MALEKSRSTSISAVSSSTETFPDEPPQPRAPSALFAENVSWQVHKFGGTSVASSDCFINVAKILEEQNHKETPQPNSSNNGSSTSTPSSSTNTCSCLAVVVSAMGGKPKTTDLLLNTVQAAANRESDQVENVLKQIYQKHETCITALFPDDESDDQKIREKLLDIIKSDLEDIRDILKTVSLMKWRANRISELVSGYGELWSTQILTAIMQKRQQNSSSSANDNNQQTQHEFVYLDARRVIIIDEEAIHDGAVVWDLSLEKLMDVYKQEMDKLKNSSGNGNKILHFIMTGYVASNTDGVATTLQRDGSDYSAAILGRLLHAKSITIWTDVDGVLSADPRRVPLAQVVPEVSYTEAMELAYFGAKVIHPKTMQPAISCNPQIPIYIRNTFQPTLPGSRIYTTSSTITAKNQEKVVCAFSSIEHMAIINVEGSGMIAVPGVAKRLFGTLEEAGVNVVLISQASSEHSITFATTEAQADMAKELIEEEFSRELLHNRISNVDVKAPCSIIAAVGDGMSETTGCSGRFFSALGDAKINIIAIAQGCSERNISAVVRSEDSVRALKAVHAAFRLSHTTIRVAVIGMNDLGKSLLRLLDAQRGEYRATFGLDLQVCVLLSHEKRSQLVSLKHDTDASSDSITMGAFDECTGATDHATFQDEHDIAKLVSGGPEAVSKYLFDSTNNNHVIFDCTNDEEVAKYHAEWLRARIDVVTANNTGLSGSKAQRKEICNAQSFHGKQSAKYLREVCVGGGLPLLRTLRTLLDTGDRIRHVDGILSVSLSFIMFRISPPPDFAQCSDFDEKFSNGAFCGDLISAGSKVGKACSFSEAVKEAIALGLMEEDPTKDLNNEYTCRVIMVLAKELGLADDLEVGDIQNSSDKLIEDLLSEEVDYHDMPSKVDELVKARVDAARSRRCVLRQISSVDVREKSVDVKIMEVPEHHLFAVTPPSCECVRFFTDRHRHYPLIVQGPSAGVDSTASALLAELLHLMRGKATPRSVALTRTNSGAVLRIPKDSL